MAPWSISVSQGETYGSGLRNFTRQLTPGRQQKRRAGQIKRKTLGLTCNQWQRRLQIVVTRYREIYCSLTPAILSCQGSSFSRSSFSFPLFLPSFPFHSNFLCALQTRIYQPLLFANAFNLFRAIPLLVPPVTPGSGYKDWGLHF